MAALPGRQPRLLARQVDEPGARLVAVLLDVVGVDQPLRVAVGRGQRRRQELGLVHHSNHCTVDERERVHQDAPPWDVEITAAL